ncbi:MAG TPA: N-6 DNA methylase [Vicingaceae bacterium]
MKLEISYNDEKDGIELLFSEQPPIVLADYLMELGFKKGFIVPLKWTSPRHPAYATYAGELKEALLKNRDYLSIPVRPSFQATEENIDHNKFSYVTISYREEEQKKQANFVIFDSYKKVAEAIAIRYGKQHYKEFLSVDVAPRKYKRKARELFSEGKIITVSEDLIQPEEKEMIWVVYAGNGKIDSFQLSEEKAKAYIERRPKFSRDKMRYEQLEKQQAFALWEKQQEEEKEEEWQANEDAKAQSAENFNTAGVEIIDQKREITPVYHGTCIPFNQFDKQFLGLKSGDIPSHLGYHFTPSKKLAATLFANDPFEDSYEHCRYIEATLKVNKTLKTTEETLVKTILKWGIENDIIQERKAELLNLLKLPYQTDKKDEKNLVDTLNSDQWNPYGHPLINYKALSTAYLNKVLKPQGFDSIWYQNGIEWAHENRYDWIVFDEKQIEQQQVEYVAKKDSKPGSTTPRSTQKLTNQHGVYTKETAGKHYETIDIPISKSAKYTASITMVKDENGAYRMATSTHKQFGDFSGHSSPVTDESKAYLTQKEALEVALKEIAKRIQKDIQSRDSILGNEPNKTKMLTTALNSIVTFAKEKDITFKENETIQEEDTKITYRLGQGWSNLDEKIITAFEQLINDHIDKLEVTPEPGYLDVKENSNPRIASISLQSDKDKIHFQAYKDNTLLISSLNPLEEGVNYIGSTMPKSKLKKAIQYMLQYSELLGAEPSKEAKGIIIKKLEAALWQKEDETYPVNQIVIKGVAYHQSRLRELLLDELDSQPLTFQLELIETLGNLFKERRPYAGSKKSIAELTKSEEKKEKYGIRSYVDDIIIDHDLWQLRATDGTAKKIEEGVMAWLINQLFESADTLVDQPTKPKQMEKKTIATNPHELNVMIEDFIVEKDSEGHVYTEQDKNYLKQYTGGGGLIKKGATGKGILYEYFTPDEIVQKMWGLAIKYGYNGGDLLEPSCGTGNFIKYAPAAAKVVGYEINPYSNRIAEILYPHATIYQQPFETLFFAGNVHLKDDFGDTRYDLVIGNPPYGEFSGKWAGMGEKKWTGATEYDQYFITRGLDLLRENGLLIFIIPSSFLSNASKYNKIKEKIAAKAKLIDAYRLPERTFKRTDIGTDIVVFRKL